jgi:hydroxypyruvate reductase
VAANPAGKGGRVKRTTDQLRRDALAIFQAGIDAVRSDRLVRESVRVDGNWLIVGSEQIDLSHIGRIAVIGAGKAGAGMAAGLEEALGPRLLREKNVTGWLNVPADCVRPLTAIHLHAARPAGVNEPTDAGVVGSQRIIALVQSLGPDDLCLCLISGGGSALLPLPIAGVTLADKQALTRFLSAHGANIRELNTVRKQLSRIKGGGLARACGARRLITLIISDVLGDPLDVIASGPTVADTATPQDALAILAKFDPKHELCISIYDSLQGAKALESSNAAAPHSALVSNLVVGNNALAVDAAGREAARRGYSQALIAATELEGEAETIGRHHAEVALPMRREPGPDALISGGEPVVTLAPPEIRGNGGRNQQLVLAALVRLLELQGGGDANPLAGLAILSGGTDGEDGPTDAAGAMIDEDTFQRMRQLGLSPSFYLARSDAYSFFAQVGGLIKTGPTHTNVCDLRVILADRFEGVGRE